MRLADRVGGGLLLAFAVYVYVGSRSMGYAAGGVPGPGFAPFWISLLTGTAAVLILVRGWTAPPSGPLVAGRTALRRTVLFTLGMAGVALLIPVLGMSLTLAVFMLIAAPLLGARNRLQVLAAAVLVPLFVRLLFQLILQVPLPAGRLGF